MGMRGPGARHQLLLMTLRSTKARLARPERQPSSQCVSHGFCDLKWNGSPGLLLNDSRTLPEHAARRDVPNGEFNEIAGPQLCIESAIGSDQSPGLPRLRWQSE